MLPERMPIAGVQGSQDSASLRIHPVVKEISRPVGASDGYNPLLPLILPEWLAVAGAQRVDSLIIIGTPPLIWEIGYGQIACIQSAIDELERERSGRGLQVWLGVGPEGVTIAGAQSSKALV